MFKILVKGVIPHLYRYEVSLTSECMFKSLGRSCYKSLNIGTGMSEQVLKTEVRLFRDSSISFYQHVYGKSDDSQINESQICIIHFFSKATAAQMASVSI